ncbi:(+)-menthofuran synthase-like [Cynara cardunculus var. scolymus]|uniref:(+)-menthofuran synthase-like n=1 Tax=Cynara cardunculus var. scolymus TaxID=59895 RepID=UPI000D62A02E|nr:(+)-menthofuran synthase-like [Cynara cardunculus var. scolymus]
MTSVVAAPLVTTIAVPTVDIAYVAAPPVTASAVHNSQEADRVLYVCSEQFCLCALYAPVGNSFSEISIQLIPKERSVPHPEYVTTDMLAEKMGKLWETLTSIMGIPARVETERVKVHPFVPVTHNIEGDIKMFLACAAFLLIRFRTRTLPTTIKKPPPSPPRLPIIGNLHQMSELVHHSFFSLARRYGDSLMLLYIGSVPCLVVSSTEAAREIMKTHDIAFASRPNTRMFRAISYDLKEITVAPYGEYWRQAKSILTLQLLSNKKVQTFAGLREKVINECVHKITHCFLSNKPADLSDLFSSLTNDITCMATFGRTYNEGEIGRKFKKVLQEFSEVLGSFYFEDSIPQLAVLDRVRGLSAKVDRVAVDFDEFLQGVVDETLSKRSRNPNPVGEDGVETFIEALLNVQKEDIIGITIDADVIKALLLDAYVAGTDTSSSVLEWAMTELLLHPDSLKKVQNEVREVLNGKKDITDDDLEMMTYLKAVIKETTRLHPPLPILPPRVARHDVKVMGYDIAEGTRVYVNIYAIMRDPKVWDRPDTFLPERFLDSPIDFVKHNFELLTFGAGRRGCPGRVFAMAINEKVLATVLHKFDWSLPNGVKREDVDMKETFGLANHRKVPLLALGKPFSP